MHLYTENKPYDNKNLMAQWLRLLLVLYHMIGNEEVMGSILIGVNSFFLQLWLIFYVILHVNWPVESIIKSHESSACAFENLDDVISIISDHLLCFFYLIFNLCSYL